MSIPVYLFVRRWDGEADYLLNGMLGDGLCDEGPALLLASGCDAPVLTQCPPQLTVHTLDTPSDLPNAAAEGNPKILMVTWPIDRPLSQLDSYLPAGHEIVQTGFALDSKTFSPDMPTARDWFRRADVIIFTHCDDDRAAALRQMTLSEHTEAGLYLQYDDDFIEAYDEEFTVCPFDLDADVIDIPIDDFGIWYFDLMEQPDRYTGRIVQFTAMLVRSECHNGILCLGRYAQISGQEDVSLLSLPCEGETLAGYPDRTWLHVTAKLGWERNPIYKKEGAVLHLQSAEICNAPDGHIVHF